MAREYKGNTKDMEDELAKKYSQKYAEEIDSGFDSIPSGGMNSVEPYLKEVWIEINIKKDKIKKVAEWIAYECSDKEREEEIN